MDFNQPSILVQSMQEDFERAARQVIFKGNSLETIKQIAVKTLQQVEGELYQERAESRQRIDGLCQQLDATRSAQQAAEKTIATLKEKLQSVINDGNQARKSAAARANRYKARFEQLLDDVDRVLPGAKELITQRAIAKKDKATQLAQLEMKIHRQKQRAQDKTYYDAEKQRDVYLSGYGKQCRILKDLLERKQRLEAKKSY